MYVSLFRTILLYLLIVVGLRIMGKRQLGEMQPSELVVTILVSNIATLPIEDSNVPFLGGAIPILTIVCFEVFASTCALKSQRIRKIISGNPRIIIRDGVIDQKELRELRLSIDDLMEQLRSSSIFDPKEVLFAILETTGKLSIYPKFSARPVTPQVLQISPPATSDAPPMVLISDGKVVPDSLHYCNLDEKWLAKTIKENGYKPEDIFLMTCNRNADYYIVPKETKQ